ncbi:hypothetical protein ES708_28696 [subsurface metagenome]
MGKQKKKDVFSNIAFGSVTESAINTLTFSEINTGVSVHQKVAWVISRIAWHVKPATIFELMLAGDNLDMALTLNNKVDDLANLSDPALLSRQGLYAHQMGTPASGMVVSQPIEREFSSLPGGGMIVTPKPLYAAVKALGFSTVAQVSCRIYFTVLELAADEFWELVQASRIVQ